MSHRRKNSGKSGTMIGVAGQDLLDSVELFGDQATHQKMRPGHRAERHLQIAGPDQIAMKSVGAADEEGDLGYAASAPAGHLMGECQGIHRSPALIEGDREWSCRPAHE